MNDSATNTGLDGGSGSQQAAPLSISDEQSRQFARLSGDFNPLHLDPEVARRTHFGGTVNHGVHVMLAALNSIAPEITTQLSLRRIKVTFHAPLMTKDEFTVEVGEQNHNRLRVVVHNGNRKIQSIIMEISTEETEASLSETAKVQDTNCNALTFEQAAEARGETPLFVDKSLFAVMFPELHRLVPEVQPAALLAATRIIGMKCPGYHSLFLQLDLSFESIFQNTGPALKFQATKSDRKSSYLEISIFGDGITGKLTSLYRPPPVAQPGFAEVSKKIKAREFEEQRALIIGGSRGLGETTAKAIAAGGGDVWITYASGASDGNRVAEEICSAGGKCGAFSFDVTRTIDSIPGGLDAEWRPNSLYYFATPVISPNKSGSWDADLYERFRSYYVDGLLRTINTIYQFWSPKSLMVMYPSTVFIEQSDAHMAEYAKAKLTGENLGEELEDKYPGLSFRSLRFTPLATDQTSSYWDIDQQPALPFILKMLRNG